MKKFELIFATILLPLDYISLLIAGTIAYYLRFESFLTDIRPVIFNLSYSDFFKILSLTALVWIAIFAFNGLYSLKRHNFSIYLAKIVISCSAATLLIVVAFFFNFQLFSSRLIILTGWLLSIIIIILERLAIHSVKKIFYKKGIGYRNVVLIGQGKNFQDIFYEFKKNPSFGFAIIKTYSDFSAAEENDFIKLLNNGQIVDDVILAQTDMPEDIRQNLINFCLENQLNYKYIASLTQTKLINFEVIAVAGLPMIEVIQTRLEGWGRIVKRASDILFSLILIFLLSPLFIFSCIGVILTSKGPVIVKLRRVGYSGRQFSIYKFRSMVKNAHELKERLMAYNERADGPLFKMQNDPRITAFGKFIRKWSLDELPQLFNVLFGSMSLVGPRPHEPEEVAKYHTMHKRLLYIKPGLTGLAQVSGRSDLSWEEETRLDIYYLENWSIGMDLQIIFKTPTAVAGKRRAV